MMPSNHRKTHRKRVSALRLSSDTTATLPEYIPSAWHRPEEDSVPSDKPPDYPDSAEEADEDTDTDNHSNTVYVPPAPNSPQAQTASPRRAKRFPTHKRRHSSTSHLDSQSTDSFLDSLLERSVHALEISNTLLQSSMSTQATVSAFLSSNHPGDSSLEARAVGLSTRLLKNWDVQESWADELNEISKDVEGLLSDDGSYQPITHSRVSSASHSLPSTSPLSHFRPRRRRPSMDHLHHTHASEPHLSFAQQDRSNLVSPPPRALTMYIASTEDPDSITLPPTLGVRSPPAYHHASDWRPLSELASSSTTSLLSTPSLPQLTDKLSDPSTPAYNMLSSLVARTVPSGTSTPSSSFVRSFRSRRRNSSSASTRSRSSSSINRSPDRSRQDSSGSSSIGPRSQRSERGISPMRPMTPPAEESSSSSDGCVAKQTVVSLRKILDDQPPQPHNDGSKSQTLSRSSSLYRRRAPTFLPLTPAPIAESGTSTATASISRLFTKGIHSSSTRPRSPPRSVMKQPSPTGTNPPPSPSTLHVPDLLGVGMVAKAFGGSTPSSGSSTPKRISFAVLPESYSSTRPEGSSSKFRDKGKGKRGRGGGAVSVKSLSPDNTDVPGWWNGWLGGGLGTTLARQDERAEDRITRNWGGKMGAGFGGGLEEWAV